MTYIEEKEKQRITQEYWNLIAQYGLEKVYRVIDQKTFVSRHDFYARYRDLYRTEDGRFSVVWKYDPEPGGYGDAFVFIEAMTEPVEIENAENLSEEELLEMVAETGRKRTAQYQQTETE